MSDDDEANPGRLLAGRYRLGAAIASGGMGAVFRATDERLAREVAVKLLPAEALGDEAARKRLLREALAGAALQHPGIVHVYDVGETDDGGAFLVMELVIGSPLRALVADDTWTDHARIGAIVEAARALAAAHRAGLVHRDVKPDNLMLRDDGRVVLLDFGVAKPATGAVLSNLTGAGVVVGTPAYLSPEQARGKPLDGRTDQFSLAVTAYELLARSIPWSATSAIEVVAAIMNDAPPALRLADGALADAVRPVLEKAMSKAPEDRYADADAFADALGEAAGIARSASMVPMSLHSRPSVDSGPAALAATALALSTPAALAPTVAVASSPIALAGRSRRARRVWPIAVGALAAVAVVGGVAIARYRANPLDTTHPVLACPMLGGTVDGKPAPWLGAAAAYRLADDLAPMLGGFDDHVRTPAALLALPGYAPDAHDLDPWAKPGFREQTMHAATAAGLPWLDGQVETRGTEVTMTVVVRTASGRELGRAAATGSPLRTVALTVSRALRDSGALGPVHRFDPEYRAWEGVASTKEQDAVADLELATLGRSAGALCRVAAPAGLPDAWRAVVVEGCAGRAVAGELPGAALLRDVMESPAADTPDARARFDRAVASASTGPARAFALYGRIHVDDSTSQDEQGSILAVVEADPRTGWNGIREGMGTSDAALIANGVLWAPDNEDWWLTATRALPPSDRSGASELLRREFILFPYGTVPSLYADSLLREGNASALAAVVAHLEGSDTPAQRDLGRVVAAQAAVLDGAFSRTLTRWTEELTAPGSSLGDGEDDNPRLASARELAYATATERAMGDAVARAIVERRIGLAIADSNPTVRLNVAATCALASRDLATGCLAALAPPASVPDLQRQDWDRMRLVVERYVAGDSARAADAARGLRGSRFYPYYGVRFGDFLVDVFDRGGVPAMAEELDAPHVDDRNLHGASLAAVRAARRAWARGDKEKARALAKRVVDAWKVVDMTVPAVAEMEAMRDRP